MKKRLFALLLAGVTLLATTGCGSKKEETPAAPSAPAAIENRAEIIAAVCAAAAEEMGTDISALRVVSFKKVS